MKNQCKDNICIWFLQCLKELFFIVALMALFNKVSPCLSLGLFPQCEPAPVSLHAQELSN